MKKSGYEQEEVRNHGLKGPRCTGIYLLLCSMVPW
jgi:hypothetical protein